MAIAKSFADETMSRHKKKKNGVGYALHATCRSVSCSPTQRAKSTAACCCTCAPRNEISAPPSPTTFFQRHQAQVSILQRFAAPSSLLAGSDSASRGGHMTNSLSGGFQANTDNPAASILPDPSSSTAPRSAFFAGPCPLPRRRCSHRQRCCQPLPTREAEAAAVTPPPPYRHKHGLPGGSALHVLRGSDPTACSQEPMMTSRPLAKPYLRAILAAGGLCFARPLGKRRARWRRRRRHQFCQELRRELWTAEGPSLHVFHRYC
ncbi:unnamed protein product [Ectocarpus sp. 12 AP-2014]